MPQKPNPRFKEFVSKVLTEMRSILLHNEYAMTIDYATRNETNERGTLLAEIKTNTVYLSFTVTIFPALESKFKKKEYYEVVAVLCHEMCHLLTEPQHEFLYKLTRPGLEEVIAQELRERQTQRICNVVMNLIDAKKFYKDLK